MSATEPGVGSEMTTADYKDHLRTWQGFLGLIKYSIGAIVLLMIFLAAFRTHN